MKSLIKYIKITAVLALVIFMTNSCTEDFDEMNTNKSLVTEDVLNTDLLLTYVEHQAFIIGASSGAGTDGNWPGMSVSDANLPFHQEANTGIWNSVYSTYARNLADLIRILENKDAESGTSENANRIAIARILKAYFFSRLTDAYGDVPYFESCLPQEEVVYAPKYDTQKSIYEDLFKELKEAAAQLDEGNESFTSADIIYGGDVVKWRKMANSLRLRLALNVRYVDPAMATSNMSDLNESNLITSAEDNAFVMTANDFIQNTNPNYNAQYSGLANVGTSLTKRLATKTMVDIWQLNGDPRLRLFADTAAAEWPGTAGYEDVEFFGYRGHPLLGDVPVEEKYPWGAESSSRWSLHMYAPVWPQPIISSQEVYFALAEAALFSIKTGDVQDLYAKGVAEALKYAVRWHDITTPQLEEMFKLYKPDWTPEQVADYAASHSVTLEDAAEFLTTSPVMTLTGSQEQQLEMIINQKIAGLYPTQTFEGWTEYRRTGYPRVQVGHDGDDLQGVSPRRFMWPDAEEELNGANYDEALERIGGKDEMLIKMWWDANPIGPHPHPDPIPTQDAPWV
ncbi:MAG: SusD/RagB family nutrient-binding outer membrane lipoprotein [Bacteroidales bacterium]